MKLKALDTLLMLTVLVTAFVGLNAHPAVAETSVSHFKIKGETLIASFHAADPNDSCVEFFVTVMASDLVERTSPPKTKVAQPLVILSADVRDKCLGIPLFIGLNANLDQAPQILQIARDLQSATLKATMPVFDFTSLQTDDFDIDLTWTATGPALRQNSKETFRDRDLGIFIQTHLKGVAAPAEVVGTVIGTAIGLQLNFTPESSIDAEILRVNNSSLIIEKTM
jgi:hypothetical protein